MSPVYLNPLPTTTTKDHDQDHFHLFMINSSPTISSTSTNHAHDPRQAHFTDVDDHHNKVSKSNSEGGSWGSQEQDQLFLAQGNPSNIDVEPARWMSCKVRSVHKTISSSSDGDDDHKASSMKMRQSPQDDPQHSTSTHDHTNHFTNKNSTIIRVCSDCNTTTTPLWRSGPQGPKSLCNACGIRQRKARRAMAEAAAVSGSEPAPAPAMKANYNKEKKARTGLVANMKKQCKQAPDHSSSNPNKKLFFKDLALRLSNSSTFQRVFPRDEEEAAFLLMELSCGFAHT